MHIDQSWIRLMPPCHTTPPGSRGITLGKCHGGALATVALSSINLMHNLHIRTITIYGDHNILITMLLADDVITQPLMWGCIVSFTHLNNAWHNSWFPKSCTFIEHQEAGLMQRRNTWPQLHVFSWLMGLHVLLIVNVIIRSEATTRG